VRPLRLDLTAFGSFAESESIEFAPLAALGLFLVTGPTGSGKTTIFDAMAFALYGKVPGDRPADVRSHHATDGGARIAQTLQHLVQALRARRLCCRHLVSLLSRPLRQPALMWGAV